MPPPPPQGNYQVNKVIIAAAKSLALRFDQTTCDCFVSVVSAVSIQSTVF